MKSTTILLILSILLLSLASCATGIPIPPQIKSQVGLYVGPMLLKVDDEWLFEENGQKILRLGFLKKIPYYDETFKESENKLLTPEQLAIAKGEITLCEFGKLDRTREINTFDIPVTNNEFWIDLYIGILNTAYKEKDGKKEAEDTTFVTCVKGVYVYHPTRKKWWGYDVYRTFPQISYVLDEELYKMKAKSSNEVREKVSEYYNAMWTDRPFYAFEILDKRVFTLPSTKVYEENLKGYLIADHSFSWFGVKPKDIYKIEDDSQ